MSLMRAIVYTQYGPPEVLRLEQVPKPVPKENQVLIKVMASTVNRTDSGFRSAEYFISRLFSGLFRPRNKVLGCEYAGVVEEVGSAVSRYKVGDRVFGYDDYRFGGHAEYLVADEKDNMALMPGDFSFEEAAPLTEGAHYALCDLRAAKIKKGDKVLVNGGTGAIGSAAVQLAKYFGATVTAVCHEQHLDLVQSIGADTVIAYNREDFTQLEEQFDIVFDAVGKSSFGRCKPLLKEKGIYMSTELGKRSENIFLAIASRFRKGKKVLFPIPLIKREDVVFLKELAEAGKFKPLIDRKYPLEQIIEAYRYVETGQKIGNVVINLV
jgi:NADPH:quinone reductase-like Zn-dependent oxidoreductase